MGGVFLFLLPLGLNICFFLASTASRFLFAISEGTPFRPPGKGERGRREEGPLKMETVVTTIIIIMIIKILIIIVKL